MFIPVPVLMVFYLAFVALAWLADERKLKGRF